ncbi:sulfotransferase family protein [Streptomyces sp. GQFP]|uniref:sulfotransferase family protein n=1 Tax=Streptomyces sp. GQFP TaxID=2907545 RepID=UPI001F2231E0|nr:sulfotransferase [Streptomyces sp. GQFP]UIX33472.1 sulfotransferase [Streptomyces sp. GQFP]
MSILRKLNSKIAETTGYQVRRVPASKTVAGAKAGTLDAMPKPRQPRPARPPAAPRHPVDPEIDRLLDRPVFVLAPVRSGSTLLRMMLGAHSELHASHELHLTGLEVYFKSGSPTERSFEALGLGYEDLEGLLWDRALHRELVKSGKPFIVEKTPGNTFQWQRIAETWPDARFVFLRRHPASVARSWHEAVPDRTREEAASRVLQYMVAMEEAHAKLGGHILTYEDLTADPATELRALCDFLDLEWQPGMLEYGSSLEGAVLGGGFGDWNDKIRSGKVQPDRPAPAAEEIPEVLREMCRTWGYL